MRLVAFLLALCTWFPAFASPRLDLAARRGRVEVFAEADLGSQARDLANSAEETLGRIAADLGDLPQPGTIEVRLVREARDLAAVAPQGRGAPKWAVGVAYPDLGIVSIALRRDGQPLDAGQTLRHELGHIALGTALGERAPHWLHEGFAYQHSAEWSWDRTETLAGMVWLGSTIPLSELDDSFPAEELPANRAYAESYDFVGYLSRRGIYEDANDDGDRGPFRRFLDEIGHGKTPDQAAVRAFGRPLTMLFDEWREDLGRRYRWMPVGILGLALWIVCALLLVVAWWRRKRQNRKRLAQWDLEEAARRAREEAAAAHVIAPPYVPWPGEDPLDHDPEDEPPSGPRWIN